MTPESPSDPHYRVCESSSSQQIVNTTASSSFSTSYTVKANGIDDRTLNNNNIKDAHSVSSSHDSKESNEKTPQPALNSIKRRNRLGNGALVRSRSFDNGNYGNARRKSLNKSLTLTSISTEYPKKKRCIENGSVESLNDKQQHNKRRRMFLTSVDQSPLWTTLTHARTISDFSLDS